MTEKKACEVLKNQLACEKEDGCDGNCDECQHNISDEDWITVLNVAIAALEKQIPKKPKHVDKNASFDGNWKKVCPACGRTLIERITTSEESYPKIYNHTPHCICGQAIDWEGKRDMGL